MKQQGFILPSPLMLVGGAALAFGITTLMFWNLYQGALNDFATYRARTEAQAEAIEAENQRILAEAKQNGAAVKAGYDNALGLLARSYNSRLNGLSASCGSSMPRFTFPTGRVDGFATDNRSAANGNAPRENQAPTFESQAAKLELDSSKTTLNLVYLQDYVERVCK